MMINETQALKERDISRVAAEARALPLSALAGEAEARALPLSTLAVMHDVAVVVLVKER